MTQISHSFDTDGSPHFVEHDAPRLNVTTLLVIRNGGPHLVRTLGALADSTRRPDRLVLIDATAERVMHDWLADNPRIRQSFPDVSVVTIPAGSTFADTIDIAVEALPAPGDDVVVPKRTRTRADKRTIRPRDKHEWFWLLHEDNTPSPGALQALVETVERTNRVGIAGCKVRELDRPRRLINVGLDVTRTGRHVGDRMQAEFDQGQHDQRTDVLAVSSSGLLIRRDVYATLGGFDPAFDGDGDGLDLCWRAHLLGHQVVVVPSAVVHQDLSVGAEGRKLDPDMPAPRSARTLRRHRQVALSRSSLLGWPLMSLWVLVSGLVLGLGLLLVKRPRRAFAEFAQAIAPFGLVRIVGARSRFFGRATARRRYLQPLFVSAGAAWGSARDSLRAAVTLQETPQAEPLVDEAVGETGPVDPDVQDAAAPRRPLADALRSPGVWAVVAVLVAAGVQWRHLLGSRSFQGRSGAIVGGELRPFGTDSTGIWHLYRDAWTGAGLGGPNQATEYLPILWPFAWLIGHIPGLNSDTAAATTVVWLLALTMPLSAISAYRAGRVLTARAWPRALIAILWATSATATTASAQGRLGPAMAHVLAPLVFAGIIAVGRPRTSASLTFGTVIAAALMGAFAPLLLAFASVAALLVVLAAHGWARLRGLLVAVLPWALLGGLTLDIIDDPRRLFAGPGALVTGDVPHVDGWQLALLHPGGPGSYPVLLGLPLLVLAVLGMTVATRGLVVVGSALLGLLGLAAAMIAPGLVVMTSPDGPRTPWQGLPLDLFALACAGLALVGVNALKQGMLRKVALHPATATAALLTAGVVAGLASWNSAVVTLRPQAQPLPDLVQSQFAGPRSVRALVLTTGADGAVTYRVQGREVGKPVTDFDLPAPSGGAPTSEAVNQLLRGQGDQAATTLHRLGVGYVLLAGSPTHRSDLRATLATGGALVTMTSPGVSDVWRVAPQEVAGGTRSVASSRLVLALDDQPAREVRSTSWNAGTHTRITGEPGRSLLVAQPPGWAKRTTVRFAGTTLAARADSGAVTYPVSGNSAGVLSIEAKPFRPELRVGQGVLWLLVVFVALPFGNRESRRRAW